MMIISRKIVSVSSQSKGSNLTVFSDTILSTAFSQLCLDVSACSLQNVSLQKLHMTGKKSNVLHDGSPHRFPNSGNSIVGTKK